MNESDNECNWKIKKKSLHGQQDIWCRREGMNALMNEWTNARTNERTNRRTDGRSVAQTNERTNETHHYLIVTGLSSRIVVTLSRKAEIIAANTQRIVISGHVLPLAIMYAWNRNILINLLIVAWQIYAWPNGHVEVNFFILIDMYQISHVPYTSARPPGSQKIWPSIGGVITSRLSWTSQMVSCMELWSNRGDIPSTRAMV